jgi:hypothetical protein
MAAKAREVVSRFEIGLPMPPPAKWVEHANLRLRPARPAAGNGRIQRAVARAFLVHGDELTTSQAFDWALPRVRHDLWRQRHRWSVVRVLRQVADPIRRVPPHGAWLWRLRTDDD